MSPLLVVIGCPADPWPWQIAGWTGAFVWVVILGTGLVVAWEKVQARLREEGE